MDAPRQGRQPGLGHVVDHAKLGEMDDEILQMLRDLRAHGVDVDLRHSQPTAGT